MTGAVGGGAKGGVIAQGLIAGGYNYAQQRYVQGKQDVDWGSVAISAGSAAASSKFIGARSLQGLSPANRVLGQTVLNGMIETPAQVINVGIQRSTRNSNYPANFIWPIPSDSKKGK